MHRVVALVATKQYPVAPALSLSFCTFKSKTKKTSNALKFTLVFQKKAKHLLNIKKDPIRFKSFVNDQIQICRHEHENENWARNVYIGAMHLCIHNKEYYEMALTIGNEMVSENVELNYFTMNVKAYNALLIAMHANEKYQEVVNLYEEIEKEGQIVCDEKMTTTYFRSLNCLEQFEKVKSRFEKIKTLVRNQHMYRAALKATSTLADVEGVALLLQDMEEEGWSLEYSDLNYAILAALNGKKYDQALEWHRQVRDSFLMSLKHHGFTYSEMIRQFTEMKEWEKVIALCEECINDGIVLLEEHSVQRHLEALLEMGHWEKAVLELARGNAVGFSDITGTWTERIYKKVLENKDATSLASVLISYVWTLQEFTDEEVVVQLTLLSTLEYDDHNTIHWLIRNGTRSNSEQMAALIMNDERIPISIKKSVQDNNVAYSDVSRFQNAVEMRRVDFIIQFLQEHQDLNVLFQRQDDEQTMDLFLAVIQLLCTRRILDDEVRKHVMIRVLESHLALSSMDTIPEFWSHVVRIMMDRVYDGRTGNIPISLLVSVVHFAKTQKIALPAETISLLLHRGVTLKAMSLLLPAYQIAIQEQWQPPSFHMAKELFEAHVRAEEWETAIGIFQNHLLVQQKRPSFSNDIKTQVVQACHHSGHPDVTMENVHAEQWQTIEFLDNTPMQ